MRGTSLNNFAVPNETEVARWYAIHTRANHEKKVLEQLVSCSFSAFLPMYKSVRRWHDRKVSLELPLFPGYLFVHMPLRLRHEVLKAAGVAQLVGPPGKPEPLAHGEIETLRQAREKNIPTDPHPYLTEGMRVRVKSGPFENLEGFLVKKKSASRVVITLSPISSSFALQFDANDIEPVRPRKSPGASAA
jgi:transcription termination/antitermination protein NusG